MNTTRLARLARRTETLRSVLLLLLIAAALIAATVLIADQTGYLTRPEAARDQLAWIHNLLNR